MASTKITVENPTAIPIYALLIFAGAHVGGADIPAVPAPTPRPGAEVRGITGTSRDATFLANTSGTIFGFSTPARV
jgi:hypothetical protein